jgi:hypothetical protein
VTRVAITTSASHHTNTYFHIQWGERPDFENAKKEHRKYMKVEPVNFNQEHKEVIASYSWKKGYIPINLAFDKLITSLRTAVAEENILEK